MPRFRVSIGGLSALILAAGILMAAARSPTEPWANGTTSLALLILGVALTGAMFRRGAGRAYWAGFAWLGWGYLLLAFGPWCDLKIAPMLVTKTAGEFLHFHFPPSIAIRPYQRAIPVAEGGSPLYMFGHQQMGHSLSALLLGLLGASLARHLASESEPGGEDRSDRRSLVRSPNPVHAAIAAVCLAGFIYLAFVFQPPEFAANGAFSTGLLVLGLAAIAAMTLRGADRAYWAGFALIGLGYLALVYGPWCETHVAPLLLTETMFRSLEEQYGPHREMFYGVVAPQGQFAPRLIGHTLSALILGLVGGEVARRFAGGAESAPAASDNFQAPSPLVGEGVRGSLRSSESGRSDRMPDSADAPR